VRRLLEAVGVDYVQWRAVVSVFLRIDFGALSRTPGARSGRRLPTTLVLVALLYGFSGIAPAFAVWLATDPLIGATLMTSVVAFMLASALLTGQGTTIVSPDDHDILGFRPISSRTYLAARVATLFVRTFVITTFVALAPVTAFLFKSGFHPGIAASALVASYAAGAAVTLAIVATYAWMLRVAGPARVLRYAAYLQLGAQTVTLAGFLVATQGVGHRAIAGLSLTGSVWALVLPGAWFGSYVSLAAGQITWATTVAVILSAGVLAALAASVGGRLSLSYAATLAAIRQYSSPTKAPPISRWLALLNNETRAAAILVRSHLRHDMKFRLGLMSVLPMTALYMFLGTRNGPTSDPVVSAGSGSNSGMIQVALMFLPMTMRQVLVKSDAFRASWIFHTTPADSAKLVLASRNLITIFFLVPYLAGLALLYSFTFHNPLHAVVHTMFLGSLSYLTLQFTIMINPQLPFSMPQGKDTAAAMTFWLTLVAGLLGLAGYVLLTRVVYKTQLRMIVAAAAIAATAFAIDRMTRSRVRRRGVQMASL
jgi:hypothetical protein